MRFRPFIIGVSSNDYLELIRLSSDAGATALSTEFFCFETRNPGLKSILPLYNKLCGFDVASFYNKYSASTGYQRLNRNIKRPFILKMKEECDKLGMRFYVSDSDFKDYNCNGSCCGLSEEWNYSRGQFTNALMIAKEKGFVKYSDISDDINKIFNFRYSNAAGMNQNNNHRIYFKYSTFAEYLHYLWNNPNFSSQTPYRIFNGSLLPDTFDENGDLIYKYNKYE